MKKIFVSIIMLFSVSFAACQIDENGVITGAACKIPQSDSEALQTQSNNVKENSKTQEQNNIKKSKLKNKRINFKFDRSLLYRNVTIIWFN